MKNKDSTYYQALGNMVIDHSEANTFQSAVFEWDVFDCREDEWREQSCICGKERLRYLFTIQNVINGNTIHPIGSSCIKKFGRADIDNETSVKEQLFKLLHAIENNSFLVLSNEFFSRKLLLHLFEEGVFKATEYNGYDPENDYQFMLDMFNKRSGLTVNQSKKTTAIILNSIRPFLRKVLRDKVLRKQ